jgi:hypothetical protein
MPGRPSFAVVAVVSVVLAAIAGLGVAAVWPSRAASGPEATTTAAGATATPAPSTPAATTTAPAITLQVDKSRAAANERINLTGNAGGPDVALVVQEREGGTWADFPAHGTTRSDGSFASYVLFGRAGEHVLRMVAPDTGRVSNPVTVTIG